MKTKRKLYVEIVRERFCGHVLSSDIRPATEEEIQFAKTLHDKGKCPHTIVYDEPGWMYDFRSCGICGCGLGVI